MSPVPRSAVLESPGGSLFFCLPPSVFGAAAAKAGCPNEEKREKEAEGRLQKKRNGGGKDTGVE